MPNCGFYSASVGGGTPLNLVSLGVTRMRPIPTEYESVVEWLLPQLHPWRKMTIAIDGVDHAGKSSLGRFLAWQAQMPIIETDFTLVPDQKRPTHNGHLLRTLIEHRHKLDRPVLVEGVFVLRQLDAIGIKPEILIEMRAIGRDAGSWEQDLAEYRKSYPRTGTPDFVVTRAAHEA